MCRIMCAWCLYSTVIFLININLFGFNKYIIKCDENVKVLSLEIAMGEVGKLEENNNSGYVEKYLKSIGLHSGNPYCMAGQYWTFEEASYKLKKNNPLLKTGSAVKEYNFLRNIGIKIKFRLSIYDLVFWRESKSWRGHIERILKVGKAGWIQTIGFNVKSDKKEGIFIKNRNIFHPINRLLFIGAVGFEDM